MKEHNEIILLFLMAWTQWVSAGAEELNWCFNRSGGLCVQLGKYLRRTTNWSEEDIEQIKQSFYIMLGPERTPFNIGDVPSYTYEKVHGLMHTNPRRRKWAHAMIKKLNQ
jgi:hypothetical protein